MGQFVDRIIRKLAVGFVGSFFLPYSIMFVLYTRGSSTFITGLESWMEVGFLMLLGAIGSFVIETVWKRKSIRIPFSYVGAHGLYFSIVLFLYMQSWTFFLAGLLMGIVITLLDRLFQYWRNIIFQAD